MVRSQDVQTKHGRHWAIINCFWNVAPPMDFRRMITNLGNTNWVGSRIIAKAIPILRPHYISEIENQAKQCASRKWPLMRTGKLKMPKYQMPINYGRVSFVEQGNHINAKTIWV